MVSEAEGRVRVETRKTLSSFVIEGAMKEDEGPYSITVTNPAGEDKAELFVKIVGQSILVCCRRFSSRRLRRNLQQQKQKILPAWTKKISGFLFLPSRCSRPSRERPMHVSGRRHGRHHLGPALLRWRRSRQR